MATSARAAEAAFGRKPDYRSANEAIDSVLANAAFDQRSTNLRKQYKSAEREYKALSRRELARGRAYEKAGTALGSQSNVVTYQNKQVEAANQRMQQLQAKWQQEAAKQAATWQQEFASKPKYADLTKKQREKAWQEYYERQAKGLDIYQTDIKTQQDILRKLGGQAQSSYSAFQRQQAAVNAYKRRYEAMAKRQKQAYDRYEQSIRRYNRFTQYVPYRPA